MKIMITGANGYIGSHVVNELLREGYCVVAVDINDNNLPSDCKFVKYDIFTDTDKNLYEKFGNPDVLLHLAWIDGFHQNSLKHIEYVSSHFKFIRNLINHGLKQVCVMGSMHEVGKYEGCVNEYTRCMPITQYGMAKKFLREGLTLLCKQQGVCMQWARGYYIIGDDLKNNSIFQKLLLAEDEGKITFPFTKGTNKFDFISIEELTKQLILIITQTKIDGIIECCSGQPIALGEKVEEFINNKHLHIRLEYGVYKERDDESKAIWGSSEKIKKILDESFEHRSNKF